TAERQQHRHPHRERQEAERPIDQLTLREMLTNAESLIRDLDDHLQKSFQPKSHAVEELVRSHNIPAERDAIPDSVVRHHVAALLSSHDYSETLIEKFDKYLTAIQERSQGAISGK
ncbi:MAG: hypothetical protein HY290_26515, partial [Planctomycetia bacterium]|nr:hypothetical protein [Planctomycetia bacterium]